MLLFTYNCQGVLSKDKNGDSSASHEFQCKHYDESSYLLIEYNCKCLMLLLLICTDYETHYITYASPIK